MERRIRVGLLMTLICGLSTALAQAETFNDQQFIRQFKQDPHSAYNTVPSKEGAPASIEREPDFSKRQAVRASIIERGVPVKSDDKSGYSFRNNPADLVDNEDLIATLPEIEERKLTQGQLAVQPWSDDYWAIYLGGVGQRYADPEFPDSMDWLENRNYVQSVTVAQAIASSSEAIATLSPGEKYGLITGDEDYLLTEYAWQEGQRYYDRYGEVETWFGICHGWAPAAYMLDRPERVIEVPAANHDFNIPFYPSDIKAMASLLWAKTQAPTKFVGGRCNDKDPETDDLGRITDEKCFDANPATFHLALVNQIGVSQRGFVMDASFDYEVWNQPVYSYQFKYFNPETGDRVDDLNGASVLLKDYSDDKFAKYRDSRTVSVVGIVARVTYMVETSPSHARGDEPGYDGRRTVSYVYDLEIDAEGKVIGGEWYQRAHPDFLWTPVKGTRALTRYDSRLQNDWDTSEPMPENWQSAAQNSARLGQPLGKIVEKLIEQATHEEL